MTEPRDEVFALLDQLVDDPTPDPPIQAVVIAGQRRRRRARSASVGLAAAAVAAIIGGSLAIAGGSGSRPTPMIQAPSLAGPTATQLAHGHWIPIPTPPAGFCDPLVIPAGRRLVALNVGYGKCGPVAAIYDAAANTWRRIRSPGPAFYSGTHGVWTGGSLVLVSSTGITARWRPATDAWQPLGQLPDVRPTPFGHGQPAAPGVANLLWTGSRVLANAMTAARATTYELDSDGEWSALASFTEPAKGIVFDVPMAINGNTIYALVATTRVHNNPHNYFTSGSVRLAQLAGDKWVASSRVSHVPKSQLTLASVVGGIAVIGDACPGEASCTEDVGEAAVIKPGHPVARLLAPESFPIQYDIAAGSNAIVATYPDGAGSYGSLVVHAPQPGTTAIYDITANRWLSGPRAPHGGQELTAHWTTAGVVDLDTRGGGWLLRPAR